MIYGKFSGNNCACEPYGSDMAVNDDDDIDFASLMSGVKRLRDDRAPPVPRRKPVPGRTRPGPEAEQPPTAPAAASGEAEFFAPGLQARLRRRIRQGLPRPEASVDLHGYRQDEALARLERFVDAALADGLRMLLVVHGQGYRSAESAVLRPLVRRWLAAHPAVLACCPAQPRDGAGGASYVYLRGA